MTEEKPLYEVEDNTENAMQMLGAGYDEPSLEIIPQQSVIRRRGFQMQEEVIPAFVKISTSFKLEMAKIGGNAMKVWIFIALSINRNTEQAHPGIRTIARYCGIKENTAISAIRELEAAGLLAVNREDRKYNIYEIPDYVSANKTASIQNETVSKIDTVKPKLPQFLTQTASTRGGLTRVNQINNNQNENNNFAASREEAKKRIAAQRKARSEKDPALEIIKATQDFAPFAEMRLRVEKALKMNLQREWDAPRSEWNGYDKVLVEREKETGQTIEQFMEWYNSDEFRKGGNIWLKPSRIEKVWVRAFEAKDQDEEYHPEYERFVPYDDSQFVPPPAEIRERLRRAKSESRPNPGSH